MKEKKWLLYGIIPVVFTLAACVIFFLGIYPTIRAAGSEWRAAWITGAPEYVYQQKKEEKMFENGSDMLPAKRPLVGNQFGEIRCGKLEGEIPLYYGDSEEILELGAGIYTGYGLPGEGKRILIGAHDTTYFAELDLLETGDEITVETAYGSYVYCVTRTEAVDVGASVSETAQEGTEELILYTCYPIGGTKERRSKRYLVYAQALQQAE